MFKIKLLPNEEQYFQISKIVIKGWREIKEKQIKKRCYVSVFC